MAIVRITDLPAATSPVSPSDVAAVVQNGVTKKAAIDQFGYLPAGTSAVTRTVQNKLRESVSVKDFGAVGDGMVDDTVALQAAFDYGMANHIQVNMPAGLYKTSSTLYIDQEYFILYGEAAPSLGPGASRGLLGDVSTGAVIQYTGTTCALQVSNSRSANPNSDPSNPGFIRGIQIINLRIEVPASCAKALWVYQAAASYFRNISLWGSQSTGGVPNGTTLLYVSAGIDNIYEHIHTSGLGRYTSAVPSNLYYVNYGAQLLLGWGNDLATTTIFRRCYFTYNNIGVNLLYYYEFEDCVFESSRIGVDCLSDMSSQFTRCWWEANIDFDIRFSNSNICIRDSKINSYDRQVFFNTGGGVKNLIFDNVEFGTTNANPFIFGENPSGNNIFSPTGSAPKYITFNTCKFPANIKTGFIYAFPTVNQIQILNMQKTVLQFTTTSLGASTNIALDADNGLTFYKMPRSGHITGIYLYSKDPLSAGTYTIYVKKNGSNIANLSYPTIPILNAIPYNNNYTPFFEKFAKDDTLAFSIQTDGSWSPTNDIVVELNVALGPSGEQ